MYHFSVALGSRLKAVILHDCEGSKENITIHGQSGVLIRSTLMHFILSWTDGFIDLVIQSGRKPNEYKAFCRTVDAADKTDSLTVCFCDRGYHYGCQ